MEPVIIQLMQDSELDEAATVLSQALLSNPIQEAVYRSHDEHTRQGIKEKFRDTLQKPLSQVFLAKHQRPKADLRPSQIVGVYRMKLCIGRPFCPLNQLPPNLNTSTVQEREQSWFESWASHDPMQRHSHLGPIGVLPECQHQGVGTQLLQHYCAWLDENRLAAYLEADKWQNVELYEKFGFRTVEQEEILGIQNYFMWREVCSQ